MTRLNHALSIALLAPLTVAVCGCGEEPAPDKIRIGEAVSLTGPLAPITESTVGPIYQMWIDEVNADGGIYIADYGKKLPIEFIRYDDESNPETLQLLLEKLMLEDQVDFLLPPIATHMLMAAAPLADKYGYILIGGPGGAVKLKEIIAGLPYFFSVLNFADTQMPALAEVLKDKDVQRVAILMVDEQHGYEYTSALVPELARRNIDVVMTKSYAFDAPDKTVPLSEAMQEANTLEADAFVAFTYPDTTFPAPGVAMGLGYRPKVMSLNVGSSFAAFRDAYGAAGVEGIVGPGAWNEKSSEAAADFAARFDDQFPTIGNDYWGGLLYYASCQFFQAAIERAGTLDQARVREVMATETFDTAAGPMKFENGLNVTHPGEIGQWQNGVFEVISPTDRSTAGMVYPKPDWPAPPAP